RLPKERLRQALLNLILNSAQAIGDNPGHIVIEARELDSDLELIVTDDGTGFPDDILAAGIHPFRTTRAKGTGLGLATVRRFVRENGGEIELSNASAAGNRRGARVALLLPSCIEHG
ncbi:ATP-binding protein, partial [Myxococcota bacterium]|nr:ATP-binding protein [Myxococcota bacterium]